MINDNSSSNQTVTPEMESAATSLLEMSSNAAARKQLKNAAPIGNPFGQVSSSSISKQANNNDIDVQSCSTDKVQTKNALILPHALVKPQSISLSAMEQLFFSTSSNLKEQSRSAPAFVDTCTDSEIKTKKAYIVPRSDSNQPTVRVEESSISSGLNMIKSKTDQTSSTDNTNNSASYPKSLDTSHTISFSPVTSPARYNIASVDPSQHQTVQNYCQNLYQGVNLYANPVTPHLPAQHFSFIQPLVSQQVPTVPYQLPSFPYIPYQTGYQTPLSGQAPTWTYIPAAENQYPLNLSLQNKIAAAAAPEESLNLVKTTSSNNLNPSQSEASLSSQRPGRKSAEAENVSEICLKRQSTPPCSEMVAYCPKKHKQEISNEPENISKAPSEPKSNFHTFVTKSDTGQTILVPTAANSMVVESAIGAPKVKSDLQALTDLTLGVGKDTGSRESRIYLGSGMTDANILHKQHANSNSPAVNVLKDTPILKELPSPNWDKISQLITSQNSPITDISPMTSERTTDQNPNGRSGEIIYIDRNRKRLSLSSFPYSQEIRIPDGQMSFIKLKGDTVAMKNNGHVQGLHVQGLSASSTVGSNTVELKSHGTGKTVKELLQLQNLNSKSYSEPIQSHGMKSVTVEGRVFKRANVDNGSSQTTYVQNITQQALGMNKTEGQAGNKQDIQVRSENILVSVNGENKIASEKVKLEDSNITVEINQGDKLNADNEEVEKKAVKQRSKSDSTCSSNVGQNSVYLMSGIEQPFRSFRNRNLKSEGDFPAEVIGGQSRSSENLNTATSNEMVHALGSNKLVTVKVSKYPNLCLPSKSMYTSPEPGTRAKKDGNIWKNNPLHIQVGKSPVIKSRPQESSHLSLKERQYLEQIQHFPRNQYETSTLAQLLMKDFKKAENVKKETQIRWKASESENINPDTELVVGRRLNLYLPAKPRALSCSDVGQDSSDMHKFDLIISENDKSTNTLQDDDVFLENEILSQSEIGAAMGNSKSFSGKQPVDMNESGDGKIRF